MDKDESWRVIAEQRLSLADLLESLTVDEWEAPSLCDGWRVRDVAAHVAMASQPPGVWFMIKEGVRAHGRFHRLNHDVAVRHAARPTERLVAELREFAPSRALPAVTNYRNALFDILVHVQDIAVPLGRDRPMPTGAALAGATRVWTMGWPFWARRRLRGVRLVATDTAWSAGEGAELRGPIDALLLLLTGRTAVALPRLAGPGAVLVGARSARAGPGA
ncbi:maleylpyruvate isomerase family mycothiol-dependent enzyme [Micromonospora sp. CPCC 206061]|uniref:maleylpyruvate isomerase family mycothiol-dependent enzyme n=1 Tax=Micromonospora sp. CPCC 206061 TaxID=3122410 RepID=UPI002FF018BC